MAYGRLGGNDLAATTNTSVYTCPADTFAVVTVNVVNRNTASSCRIRIAIATSSTPTNAEYIEYDSELLEYGVLERTGVVVGAGQIISVYSSATNVTVTVFGIETSTA